jgi:hypothetical protein
LVQEAAGRNDAAGVAALLDEAEVWRRFRPGPPRFVLRAVAHVVAAQPNHPAWKRSLGRWLQTWDGAVLGPVGTALAGLAGVAPVRAADAEPPLGLAPVPWFLHQASRAWGRDDPAEALAFVRRALEADPGLAAPDNDAAEARLVRDALPGLEHRARAQALASLLGALGVNPVPAPGLLVDVVDLLGGLPGGRAVLGAAEQRDHAAAWEGLASLLELPDLPPRLAHHLALLEQRAARALEDADRTEDAAAHWRRSWRSWLRYLSRSPGGEGGLVFDWLLTDHRHRINDLLARDAVGRARLYWDLVRELPRLAAGGPLGDDLAGRVARFREDLATEYLLTTREAMRYGAVPEGWRADYEKGLGLLRRLLSLDRDNVRLLTALVEVCTEWFLDLYRQGDGPTLREQTERFTPFARQLARQVEGRPGELAARAAVADFYKFRGFISRDRGQKVALYREALRFNPANDNVRTLLAELEPPPPEVDPRGPDESL